MRFLGDAVLTILLLAVVVVIVVFSTIRRGALAANEEPSRRVAGLDVGALNLKRLRCGDFGN